MKAEKFNAQYERFVVAPLLSVGFAQHRNCLKFVKGSAELMVYRHRNKWSALCQDTYFTVCVRHTFLRDLDTLMGQIYDYPFKIGPSLMTAGFYHNGWHYQSYNEIGRWPMDMIEFGKMRDAKKPLERLCETVLGAGVGWMEFLTPAEAQRQIKRHGQSDYCEKLWIEDYEKYARAD